MQIHALYMAGLTAKLRCSASTPIQPHFFSNLQVIYFRATETLRNQRPELDAEQASRAILLRSAAVADGIAKEIEAGGCASERIQQTLKIQQANESMHDMLKPAPPRP